MTTNVSWLSPVEVILLYFYLVEIFELGTLEEQR